MRFKKISQYVTVGSDYPNLVTDYYYDEVEDVVKEKSVPKDMQAYIDSFADCALDKIYDKFVDTVNVQGSSDVINDFNSMKFDLNEYSKVLESADNYREDYNLYHKDGRPFSEKEVWEYVSKLSSDLETQIKNNMGGKDNVKTEETVEEKKS